jgi:hypothetical protein
MATALENALTQLKDSAREKKLVGVIGTGVSMALTNGKNPALSWRGLIESGFAYGLTKAKITPSQKAAWTTQLSSDDMDDLLGAAEFMSRKLDAPNGDLYARWLESVFKDSAPENAGMVNAIRALQSAEIPLCTLNYDSLLERVMRWPEESYLRNTYGRLASYRHPLTYWEGKEGREHIMRLLRSQNLEENARGLLTIPGALWGRESVSTDWKSFLVEIERYLFSDNSALWVAAAWAFGRTIRAIDEMVFPAVAILDRLLLLCALEQQPDTQSVPYALSGLGGLPRESWTPDLTEEQRLFFKNTADTKGRDSQFKVQASLIVAFHSKDFWTEEELAKRLIAIVDSTYGSRPQIERMLRQMGDEGQNLLHLDKEKNQASE